MRSKAGAKNNLWKIFNLEKVLVLLKIILNHRLPKATTTTTQRKGSKALLVLSFLGFGNITGDETTRLSCALNICF